MARPIAAFTGDDHLRPSTWAKHPDLNGDAYVSYRQIVDFCVNNRLPLILLGDLFDKSRPDSLSVGMYLHSAERLRQAGQELYYIEGNHDKADPPWPSLTPWAKHVLHDTIGGVRFYGMSFATGQDLTDQLAAMPADAQILLAHQSWAEIQGVGHTDASFAMIPRGIIMLTGDYHVCGEFNGVAANGETVRAFSTGSTYMQALNEPVVKYFGVLHDDLSVVWVPLLTRPVMYYVLKTEEELSILLQQLTVMPDTSTLPVEIQKPILRIKYNDAIPEAHDRLEAVINGRYHFFPEPHREIINQIVDASSLAEETFASLTSAALELGDKDPHVQDAIRRVATTTDPTAEWKRIFEEFKARNGQENPAVCNA